MPSHSACNRSAAKRAFGSRGMMRPPPATMIEIIQDHGRVVQDVAVIEDQRRNFAERILYADAVGRIVEIGFAHVDLVGEAEQTGRDAHLAAEG